MLEALLATYLTTGNIETVRPQVEAFLNLKNWDQILHSFLRNGMNRLLDDSTFDFHRNIVLPLKLCFTVISTRSLVADDLLIYPLIEEATEITPLNFIHLLGEFLEDVAPIIKKGLVPGRGKALLMLRICNEMIKKTQYTHLELRGRAYLLSSLLFPMNDRSALNMKSIPSSVEVDKILLQLVAISQDDNFNQMEFGSALFYTSFLYLQKILASEFSVLLESYDSNEDSPSFKLWVLFLSFIEVLFNEISTLSLCFCFEGKPWSFLYSHELFRFQVSHSLQFWISLSLQLINYVGSLLDFLKEEPVKRTKKIAKDENILITKLDKILATLRSLKIMAHYVDGVKIEEFLYTLEEDERAWRKWRLSGSVDIPHFHADNQTLLQSFDPNSKPLPTTNVQSYSFLAKRELKPIVKFSLYDSLSVLKEEDPSDKEGLYHDQYFLWKALRVLILHLDKGTSLPTGSIYESLVKTIGSVMADNVESEGEDKIESEIGHLYRQLERSSLVTKPKL